MVGQDGRAAWERLPDETDKAYEAFVAYRDMGASRSLRKLATQLGKSTVVIERWSRRNDWVNRCRQWDEHLAKKRNEAWELAVVAPADEVAEMNRRHAQMALDLQVKALEALQQMLPSELGPKDVLNYLVEATKLERQARGEPEAGPEEEVADQEIVIQLLADPDSRRMAAQLATRVRLPSRNGHGSNGQKAS